MLLDRTGVQYEKDVKRVCDYRVGGNAMQMQKARNTEDAVGYFTIFHAKKCIGWVKSQSTDRYFVADQINPGCGVTRRGVRA